MKSKTSLIIFFNLFIIFQSCKTPKLDREYFIGTWQENNGAVIELFGNGECIATGLNQYKIHPFEKNKNKLLNFRGTWDLINGSDPKLHLSYSTEETYQYKGTKMQFKKGIDFNIVGKGLLERKPPYDLFVFVGDPVDIDESNKYRFTKQ